MNLDEKLEYFYKSAIDEATKKSLLLIDDYKESLEKVYEESKCNLLRKADVNFNLESRNLLREKNKVLSNELSEERKILNDRTEELTHQLFEEVKDKLFKYRTTSEYKDMIVNQILQAKKYADATDMFVYMDPDDKDLVSIVEEKTSSKIELYSSSFLGGTKIVIPSKNVLIDNSFLSKLEEEKDTFSV